MAKRHHSMRRLEHTVLAHGEVTGHAHRVHGHGVALYETEDDEVLVLEVPNDAEATVSHEEHHTQPIPPGVYERRIVREYDHFAEEARQVRD